jgi:putrescine transport system permease protein
MIMPAVISGWLLAFTCRWTIWSSPALFPARGPRPADAGLLQRAYGGQPGDQRPGDLILGVVGIVGFIAWYLMARAEKQRVRDIQRARRG